MRRKISSILAAVVLALVATCWAGPATLDLGHKELGFGSSQQAMALLGLMNDRPRQGNYQITYTTAVDAVIFGCDFNKEVIARIHQRNDGKGTAEKWQGHVIDRLNNAAQGGSLNDTSTGKIPGSMQRF